ncbi:imidazole glycerol phosphate synthase subunit HisH [Helicobacter cappadocius]|uniref:Imidazole glycerol phosphate synthase subunit HisH n=1 Tax=Helicobacter cappadocius TaxID=3063998 RepID=A0AA90SS33_9HELI|nr:MULTISPECIES: imidazole glycerol phosphate synthase subunit HisH [unclassified Helicobacter]MDO7252622.1 imidazole glycerol phosphate synthase subunit HisH [Helicobacter sp. faydin-H75]MDP2538489.1 imidazole glycerol phosphate synthase subunit HisH [Helicobacter sp. faydin-H76]
MQIAILNYNIGNLASVKNALENTSIKNLRVDIQDNPDKLLNYDKIILPGVGAFGDAISCFENSGLKESFIDFIKSGKYVLGICLGMQLLFEKSFEFGEHKGLGLIRGEVIKFNPQSQLKIPHMGWNTCRLKNNNHPLFKNIKDDVYLYFVHSYHVTCKDSKDIIGTSEYGYIFPSIIAKENILGMQPHPEKSHQEGLKILENFLML